MLAKIRELVDALNESGIRYCHWKSNVALSESLLGKTDVDLLIARKEAGPFRTLLAQNGFQPAVETTGKPFPSTEHYYALDSEQGELVHVHAYFRAITGESLSKNYRLPLEEMLLENTREIQSVKVPVKGAELIVFTLRIMLKHTSAVERFMLARDWKHTRDEADWLVGDESMQEALHLLGNCLPNFSKKLFSSCVLALRSNAPLLKRIILGHLVRYRLWTYSRHSSISAWIRGGIKFSKMAFRRLSGSNSTGDQL